MGIDNHMGYFHRAVSIRMELGHVLLRTAWDARELMGYTTPWRIRQYVEECQN